VRALAVRIAKAWVDQSAGEPEPEEEPESEKPAAKLAPVAS
jgi:hypothetical protein